MKKYILAFILTYALCTSVYAKTTQVGAHDSDESQAYIMKQALILKTTDDYSEALKTVKEASKKLGFKVDVRGLKYNKKTGLTFDKKECANSNWDFPCYVERGREEEEKPFLSIEYSNFYKDLEPGNYLVMAAIQSEDKRVPMNLLLEKTEKHYPAAYIKEIPIYMGCIH